MVNYPSEKQTKRKSVVYDAFRTANFAEASANLDADQSPDVLNMVPDGSDKVRRRMGYFEKTSYPARIWGMTQYKGNLLVHAGDTLYKDAEILKSGLNTARSFFYQQSGKLYVMDGAGLYVYDGTTCAAVEGKIPIVIISGNPSGGGTAFEQVNLIQDKWEQDFLGDGSSKEYQLAYGDLDENPLTVQVSRLEGEDLVWDTLTEEDDYTVDRENGIVTFVSAPAAPPVAQEDNVKIVASKDRSEQRERIFSSTIWQGFGQGGHDNQLFVSGSPDYKNYVFWSGINDLTYWGDLQYVVLGQDDSAIVSFNTLNTGLVCHKDAASGKSYVLSVFTTNLNELTTPQVAVDRVISGSGCICKYASASFGEPLFVTNLGIQALTNRDLTGYEVETIRGEMINRRLLTETNLVDAVSCVFKSWYLLAVGSHIYLLDRRNPRESGGVLNNAYQYNAFFWDDVPAVCFFVDGDNLLFGTTSGKVMQFYSDDADPNSYNDAGQTYEWRWEFPEYVGDLFYQNKAIRYVSLRAKAYQKTTVTIDVQLRGLWYEVLTDSASFGFLDLSSLDLGNLNLSTDSTPKKTYQRFSERKLDKFAFRVRGSALNEPFGLYSFAFEVKERGKHKN